MNHRSDDCGRAGNARPFYPTGLWPLPSVARGQPWGIPIPASLAGPEGGEHNPEINSPDAKTPDAPERRACPAMRRRANSTNVSGRSPLWGSGIPNGRPSIGQPPI